MQKIENKFFKKGLPSFCTSNMDVVDVIFKFCKLNNLPVLIESTSNQVNQNGGYTGLKPQNFKKKINEIAKKNKFKLKRVLLGGDHLGPLPWKDLKKKIAMRNAKLLVKNYIKTGYKKIHLDTAILCSDQKKISREEVIHRCFFLLKDIPTKYLKNIFFVVGTEVPAAGGGDHTNTMVTKLDNIKRDFNGYRNFFKKMNFGSLRFALVIDPGIAFKNLSIKKSKFKDLNKKSNFSKINNFVFEAHSSDYQSMVDLRKLYDKNFKFLKVGPELTYNYMKAILLMEKIEMNIFSDVSNIRKTISKQMDINKKYWAKYYKKSSKNNEFLKFHSFLDRARYYWSNKKVHYSKQKLFKNINNLNHTEFCFFCDLSKKDLYFKKKRKLTNVDFILFKFLKDPIMKYYLACRYKIKSRF